MNPKIAKEADRILTKLDNGERVLRLPNDKEIDKLSDPLKIGENFFPNVSVNVQEKESKEEYIQKLKKDLNYPLDFQQYSPLPFKIDVKVEPPKFGRLTEEEYD